MNGEIMPNNTKIKVNIISTKECVIKEQNFFVYKYTLCIISKYKGILMSSCNRNTSN